MRKALVASQVAVSLLLLLGAGLFIRTLSNLTTVDLGFRPHNLIAFEVDPSRNGYDGPRTRQFAKTLLERLQAMPGVESAGLATVRILEGDQWGSGTTIEGYQSKPREDMQQQCNAISPGYFKALGMPLVAGRDFTLRDEYTAGGGDGRPDFRVAIVNERFVTKYFPHGNAIGRRIGFGTDPGAKTNIEIVGVVKNAKYTDVRSEIRSQVFFPYLEDREAQGFVAYLRTTRDVESAFTAARRTVQGLDQGVADRFRAIYEAESGAQGQRVVSRRRAPVVWTFVEAVPSDPDRRPHAARRPGDDGSDGGGARTRSAPTVSVVSLGQQASSLNDADKKI